MTNKSLIEPGHRMDWFGRQVATRLSAGTAELPYDISERLRAARMQAVARRKQAHRLGATPVLAFGGAATLGFDREGPSLWNRIASVLPLVALAAGLILINAVQNDWRAREVAEVDAALLTDDLPPAAYADSGFLQFLKSGGE